MRNLLYKLQSGQHYFGSGSHNSPEFNEFFMDFKKSFTNQLKKLNADTISFSKGHFYLSGFFKVEGQFYYFSLSDVRSYNDQLLIRTAKSAEDYTGGTNNYITIDNGMYKLIARTFKISIPSTHHVAKKKADDIADEIIEAGFYHKTVPSAKQANAIAWALDDKLKEKGNKSTSITEYRNGRTITQCKCSTEEFSYLYDASSKKMSVDIFDKDNIDLDKFVKTLPKYHYAAYRVNPYTEQGLLLAPKEVALYDYIKDAERNKYPLFGKALFEFRKAYPDTYMALLD